MVIKEKKNDAIYEERRKGNAFISQGILLPEHKVNIEIRSNNTPGVCMLMSAGE